ncbi:hypothetical protein GBA52_015643 [Prunus armeniaca]|nr:hypothetical protein GBA52_015643 [Prunus armeniaca]
MIDLSILIENPISPYSSVGRISQIKYKARPPTPTPPSLHGPPRPYPSLSSSNTRSSLSSPSKPLTV